MLGTGPFTISPVNLPARLVGGSSIDQPYFAPVSIAATAAADGSSYGTRVLSFTPVPAFYPAPYIVRARSPETRAMTLAEYPTYEPPIPRTTRFRDPARISHPKNRANDDAEELLSEHRGSKTVVANT